MHIGQLEKQRATIKEMELEYLKDNANETLEMIKLKIFNPSGQPLVNNLTPSRTIFEIENDSVKEESRVSKMESEFTLN